LTAVRELANQDKKVARLTKSSKILKVIINAIQDRKGESIVSLDMRKIPEAVADFFIICEAGANTQVKAIADAIEDQVHQACDELPYRHEGYQALQWVLIDYVNVVVHIFQKETRKFYRLEEMWSDGVMVEHEDPIPPALKAASAVSKRKTPVRKTPAKKTKKH
jgi:ribosome-associated protein